MTRSLDLGFVALSDAAALIAGKERGFFEEEGLDVRLHREVSWATVRDKVAAGWFNGAHMLAPLALATRLGLGVERSDVIAPMSLNTGGASIGISAELARESGGQHIQDLIRAAGERVRRGSPPVTFATVYPYSMHTYMLRFWAASAGLDPDRDMRIVTAPPTAIVDRLKAGAIDGFVVGAPWGAVCEAHCGARLVLDAAGFWPGAPDKVLGISEAWATREPSAVQALLRAVLRATMWADAPENVDEMAAILSAPSYLAAPADLIAKGLGRKAHSVRFARSASVFPWKSHAAWIVSQMIRWGQAPLNADTTRALDCYRPDLLRTACEAVAYSMPLADSKLEGAHDAPWALPGSHGPIPMTPDRLIDGRPFNPDSLQKYAASFAISRLAD